MNSGKYSAAMHALSTYGNTDTLATLPHPVESVDGDMIYRELGTTGENVSLIGLGGYHIGGQDNENDSIEIIRAAIDAGVTFMDNSWDYYEGVSEVRMGKALRDGYRDRVFLMTKIDGRTRKEATRQLENSLQRLQTDVIDLLQFHEVIRMEDPDRIFADGGAFEAVKDAQKAGKVRYIGFTGHKDPFIHLRMLEIAAEHGVTFDTVQMPLNVLDVHYRSFCMNVLPVPLRKGTGVLGMKSMGDGLVLKSGKATPVECLHFAMNLPVSTVITGIDSMDILSQDLEAVRSFEPMTGGQMKELLDRTGGHTPGGSLEMYKNTAGFDATAQNPEWLGAFEEVPAGAE